jgi:DNA-binding CsgD family transcriptional regulator
MSISERPPTLAHDEALANAAFHSHIISGETPDQVRGITYIGGIALFNEVGELSPDHRAYAAYAMAGATYRQAAEVLGTEPYEVKNGLHKIYEGLGVDARSGLFYACVSRQVREMTIVRPATRAHLDGLSDREIEIVAEVGYGQSNAEIAEKIGLSPLTVKKHLERISQRFGSGERTYLAAAAILTGLTRI